MDIERTISNLREARLRRQLGLPQLKDLDELLKEASDAIEDLQLEVENSGCPGCR